MSNRERFAELLARREELGRLILANATDATAANYQGREVADGA